MVPFTRVLGNKIAKMVTEDLHLQIQEIFTSVSTQMERDPEEEDSTKLLYRPFTMESGVMIAKMVKVHS